MKHTKTMYDLVDSNHIVYGVSVDEHGNQVKRTPSSHPYAFDGYVTYRGGLNTEITNTMYSDRMHQWDSKRFNECCRKIWGNEGQYFSDRKAEDVERFIEMYTGKPVKLILIMHYCNQSSGYPLWRFDYMEDIKVPYCTIDGEKFQLEWVRHVLRFPNYGELKWGKDIVDINRMVLDYCNGKTTFKQLFEIYTSTGNSYDYVYGLLSVNGMNNHIITQGKEKAKRFRLHMGKLPWVREIEAIESDLRDYDDWTKHPRKYPKDFWLNSNYRTDEERGQSIFSMRRQLASLKKQFNIE